MPALTSRALRALSIAATGLLLVSATACGDDDSTGPSQNDVGTYDLTVIDQGSGSCTITSTAGCQIDDTGGSTIIVDDATLTLSSGGTFTFSANGTEDGVDQNLAAIGGTWATTSTGVNFTVPGISAALPATRTSTAGELVLQIPGGVFASGQSAVSLHFIKR